MTDAKNCEARCALTPRSYKYFINVKGRNITPTKSAAAKKSNDAIALLKADHDKVKKMFGEFARLHEQEEHENAEQVARQICNELTVHATIEEEIFYPEVRAAIGDDDLMDEAEVEHAGAKDLIAQLEGMNSGDDKFAAKVTVLGENIDHHVKEEQDEMFPKARKAKVDLAEMGTRMMARQQELKAQMGMDDEAADAQAEQPAARGKKPTRAGTAHRA